MSEDPDRELDQGPSRSVFGNLPDSRPGTRSPRRETADRDRRSKPPAAGAAEAVPDPGTVPSRAQSPRQDSRRQPASAPEPDDPPQPASIEDLAWAGVAALAETATAGVRLASRAIEALRETAERR